jgi:hypothetical protein
MYCLEEMWKELGISCYVVPMNLNQTVCYIVLKYNILFLFLEKKKKKVGNQFGLARIQNISNWHFQIFF